MAEIEYTRLEKEIIRDTQTGATLLKGAFVSLPWVPVPVASVVAVYWQGHAGETFRQSLALADQVGNILDETPAMKPLLDSRQAWDWQFSMSSSPSPDRTTSRSIYRNGVSMDSMSFDLEHGRGETAPSYDPGYRFNSGDFLPST